MKSNIQTKFQFMLKLKPDSSLLFQMKSEKLDLNSSNHGVNHSYRLLYESFTIQFRNMWGLFT